MTARPFPVRRRGGIPYVTLPEDQMEPFAPVDERLGGA